MEPTYEGYQFNEIAKQFEPFDDTCVYCQKSKATSDETHKYLKLYKAKDRTNLIVYRSVKYSEFTIVIPRCRKCHTIHSEVKSHSNTRAWLSFLLILPIGYSCFGGVLGIFVSLLSAIPIAFYVQHYSERRYLEKNQLEPEWIVTENVKLVRDFLNDGWTGVPPSA